MGGVQTGRFVRLTLVRVPRDYLETFPRLAGHRNTVDYGTILDPSSPERRRPQRAATHGPLS